MIPRGCRWRPFDAAGDISGASGTAAATTAAAPANLAAGKPHASTLAADAAYPGSGGELDNGGCGTTPYASSAWSFTDELGVRSTTP